MSGYNTGIYGFTSAQLVLGTSGIAVGVTIGAGAISALIKWQQGGSLLIGGIGLTNGNGYLMGTTEAIAADVRGTYYLLAVGATTTVNILIGISEGVI